MYRFWPGKEKGNVIYLEQRHKNMGECGFRGELQIVQNMIIMKSI